MPSKQDRQPVRSTAKFEGVTESRSAYQPKQRESDAFPVEQGEASEPWWQKTTFRGESESRSAYTPKEVEKRVDTRVDQSAVARSHIKFDGVSESRSQFTPKRTVKDVDLGPEGPSDNWWEKTKFTGESESKTQYTPKELDRPEMPNKQDRQPVRSTAKFEGVTESQSAFQPKVADRSDRSDQGPQGEPWWEKTKVQGMSEHHAQYTPKPLEQRQDLRLDAGKMKVHRAMVHLEPSLGQVRDSMESSAHGPPPYQK
jgi:hypothetical protein